MPEQDRAKPKVGETEPGEAGGYQADAFSRDDEEGVPADDAGEPDAVTDAEPILEAGADGRLPDRHVQPRRRGRRTGGGLARAGPARGRGALAPRPLASGRPPVAVEAERHAARDLGRGDRAGRDVLGVVDHEVAAVLGAAVDQRHQPAVALGRVRPSAARTPARPASRRRRRRGRCACRSPDRGARWCRSAPSRAPRRVMPANQPWR